MARSPAVTATAVADAGPTVAVPRITPAPEPALRRPERRWGAIVAIATALALLLALIVVLLVNSDLGEDDGATPTADVPGVVGIPFDQADAQLTALGFEVAREDTESVGQPANLVLGQSPERGRKIDEGSTVTLTVSSPFLTLPDVVGKSRDEATTMLRQKGIGGELRGGRLRPAARHRARHVSTGRHAGAEGRSARRPADREGAGGAGAGRDRAGPDDRGRRARRRRVPGASPRPRRARPCRSGSVIGTDPPAGTPLPKGTEITLIVSSGPDLIDIPNVVGQDATTGVDILTDAGFNVTITYRNVGAPNRDKIVAQSPSSGHALRLSNITVVVGN